MKKKVKIKTPEEIEKEFGVKFDANPKMLITTWLRLKGIPNLAKALKLLSYV